MPGSSLKFYLQKHIERAMGLILNCEGTKDIINFCDKYLL